ncbi:hypothetical protein BJV74DRAFT_817907 [Russula compacta]|nr:hypothetical protein BJV74DRAFT_817907 [Russula compacta]
MDKVNIFLNDDNVPTLFLSIPKEDIKRLTLSPHKWLRFVMFAICGSHGVLSATPGGSPVQDNTTFANILQSYYYMLQDTNGFPPSFIDYNALNEHITSTAQTPCANGFRDTVLGRDGHCAVTRRKGEVCDAAHIVPRCKGTDYIQQVIRSRHYLYPSLEIDISSIDDLRNGILLSPDLHRTFGQGELVFLKTPNFVLSRDDIPSEGVMVYQDLPYRITMQHFVPDSSIQPLPDHDAYLIGMEDTLPPAIILDFIYGAAAYKHWRSDKENVHEKLQSYFTEVYEPILRRKPSEYSTTDFSDGDPSNDDEVRNATYMPPNKNKLGNGSSRCGHES